MPQMSPLSWLSLFMIFSITLILFTVMNYFINSISPPYTSKEDITTQPLNWKW